MPRRNEIWRVLCTSRVYDAFELGDTHALLGVTLLPAAAGPSLRSTGFPEGARGLLPDMHDMRWGATLQDRARRLNPERTGLLHRSLVK